MLLYFFESEYSYGSVSVIFSIFICIVEVILYIGRCIYMERANWMKIQESFFSFLSSSSPLGQTAVSGNFTLHQRS